MAENIKVGICVGCKKHSTNLFWGLCPKCDTEVNNQIEEAIASNERQFEAFMKSEE
jgi:hypothetical protein